VCRTWLQYLRCVYEPLRKLCPDVATVDWQLSAAVNMMKATDVDTQCIALHRPVDDGTYRHQLLATGFTGALVLGTGSHVAVMWSETVGLTTRPVSEQQIGLGLAVLVLCCETRSCHARRHNDLEGHSNFSSTIYSFSILCLEHYYCEDQQWRSLTEKLNPPSAFVYFRWSWCWS